MRLSGYYWVWQKATQVWTTAFYNPNAAWCWTTLEVRCVYTETEFKERFVIGKHIPHPDETPIPPTISAIDCSEKFLTQIKEAMKESYPIPPDDTVVATTSRAIEQLKSEKNQAYEERNMLVVALVRAAIAQGWVSGRWFNPDEEDGWGWMAHIELPTGRADWHFPDSAVYMLENFPILDVSWGDYSTEEKYERVLSASFESAHQHNVIETKLTWLKDNCERVTLTAIVKSGWNWECAATFRDLEVSQLGGTVKEALDRAISTIKQKYPLAGQVCEGVEELQRDMENA